MHMSYKSLVSNIEEYSYDSILDLDDDEVEKELVSLCVNIDKHLNSFKKVTQDAVLLAKKQKLKNVRAQLDQKHSFQPEKSKLTSFLERKGVDAKGYLIELFISGRATLAFRDGQDLSDDEALCIINNLIELGEVNIDE